MSQDLKTNNMPKHKILIKYKEFWVLRNQYVSMD